MYFSFTGKTIEPPAKTNIDGALVRLQDVGALDSKYALTALGRHLAALPVDVRIGKLMLFGAIFCCVDSSLTMAACLSHKSPFVAPFGKKAEADAKRREFACSNSDQLTTLRAYRVRYFYTCILLYQIHPTLLRTGLLPESSHRL